MSGYAKYFPLLRARFCLYGAHAAKWHEKREAAYSLSVYCILWFALHGWGAKNQCAKYWCL